MIIALLVSTRQHSHLLLRKPGKKEKADELMRFSRWCFRLLVAFAILTAVTHWIRNFDVPLPDRHASFFTVLPLDESSCSTAASCHLCATRHLLGCTWCVESHRCLSSEAAAHCTDAEAGFCSPILLRPLPGRIRVIYVGKRSGGPEALVQLHLALLHWGFNSTLETRTKQVGKGLLPFFKSAYAEEFRKYGVRMHRSKDYGAFLASGAPEDILVLTETWPCKRPLVFFQGTGARQVQYYLTAQPRRWTYDISHMYISDAYPEACTIVAHTDFIANNYLNISRRALLRPYISPHILKRGAEYRKSTSQQGKKSTVLYDGDAGIDERAFSQSFRTRLRKAASLKPDALYSLMEKSRAVIDFAMPGAERLVFEAALFNCVPIINDELNGASEIDFPLPPWARIVGRNASAVESVVDHVDKLDAEALKSHLSPFIAFVEKMKPAFLRSVRQYFSDSLHVIIRATGFDETLMAQLVSFLIFVPLGTISVVIPRSGHTGAGLPSFQSFRTFLAKHYFLSSVEFTTDVAVNVPQSAAFVLIVDSGKWFVVSGDIVGALAVESEAIGSHPFYFDLPHGGLVVFFASMHWKSYHSGWSNDDAIRNMTTLLAGWKSAAGRMVALSVKELAASKEIQSAAVWQNFCEDFPTITTLE